MKKAQLKKELHELIDKIEDEEMLNMAKEDIVAYQKPGAVTDYLSYLTQEEIDELEQLANEDPEKDSVDFETFKKNIDEWRSGLLQKRDSKPK